MCCLYGLIDSQSRLSARQKTRILMVLGTACEQRGTDATGVAYISRGKLRIYKRAVPARRLRLKIPGDAQVIMGHTRMTTQGNERFNPNNHPFAGSTPRGDFALAHNGVLWNDKLLRETLNLPNTRIETDSYIGVQLIEQQKALNFSALKYMAEQVEGSFTFTVLDHDNSLYFIKGDNPLCIYSWPELGVFLYASLEEILRGVLPRLPLPGTGYQVIKPACGEILCVDQAGGLTRDRFDDSNLQLMADCCDPAWYRWGGGGCVMPRRQADPDYLDDLRMVAGAYGYDRAAVDRLIRMGFTPEDIEEFLYCGEL